MAGGIVTSLARRISPGLFREGAAGAIESAILPTTNVLARRGGHEGARIAAGLRGARALSERAAGAAYDASLPALRTFTPDESTNLAQALAGSTTPVGRSEQIIRGLQPFFARAGKDSATIIKDLTGRGVLGPGTLGRGDRLLPVVLREASDAMTSSLVDEHLAPIARSLAETNPAAGNIARRAIASIRRGGAESAGPLLGNLQAFNAATLLGRAVLLNVGQSTLPTIVAGLRPVARAAARYAADPDEARRFALRAGVALDSAVGDFLRSETGGRLSRVASGVLKVTGHTAVERFNRNFAASIGREWYGDLQRLVRSGGDGKRVALARRHLSHFGINPSRVAAGLDAEDDVLRFSQRFTNETQFRTTPEELPLLADSPWWRAVFQFKSFSLKATELLVNQIERNPASLLRVIPAGLLAGVPIDTIRRLTAGQPPTADDRSALRRAITGIATLGVGGLFTDAIQAASFGRRAIAETIGGPVLSTIAEAGEAAAQLTQGRTRPAAELIAGRVPTIGPALRRQVRESYRPATPLTPRRLQRQRSRLIKPGG